MAARILPTPEQLRELLRYEPETGKLFWKPRDQHSFSPGNTSQEARCSAWNKRYANKEAFATKNKFGYFVSAIFDKKCMAHRVAWAIHYGEFPEEEIDHINRDRGDNRISNLRKASRSENCWNMNKKKNSGIALKGAYFEEKSGRWMSKICVYGHQKHIGRFDSQEEAHAAYCEAAKKYHGEFARTE